DRKETITRGLVIGILRGAGAGVKGPVYHHPAVHFACQPPYRTDHLSLHRIDEVCDSEDGLERRGSNPLVPAQRVFGKHENGILNRKKVGVQGSAASLLRSWKEAFHEKGLDCTCATLGDVWWHNARCSDGHSEVSRYYPLCEA